MFASRASTPKNGDRERQGTSSGPTPSSAAENKVLAHQAFLQSDDLRSSITELLGQLVEYRPDDPLLFVAEYFNALAEEEDEVFRIKQEQVAANSRNRKKDKQQAQQQQPQQNQQAKPNTQPKQTLKAPQRVTRGLLPTKTYMLLKLEMQRVSRQKPTTRPNARLQEILASAFAHFSESGIGTCDVEVCEALLKALAADMGVPDRASSQLVSALRAECKSTAGCCSFAQFVGAGRSLAMLPGFLKEAERLCAKLNGRYETPTRNTIAAFEAPTSSPSGSYHGMDAVVDAESLCGALPTESGSSTPVRTSNREVAASTTTSGLREALENLLGADRRKIKQIGVFDIISATLS